MDEMLAGMPIPPDMPPELAKIFLAETRKAVQNGESLDGLLSRLFGDGPGGRKKKRQATIMDAREILGVRADAGEEEIRAAYLRKVKEHPPERSPEEFEKIRDAYRTLRDPRSRMRDMLLYPDPGEPLVELIAGEPDQRRFVGPQPWLEVLKAK